MNKIENKNTDLPPELLKLYQTHEKNALAFMDGDDFSTGEKEYRTLLSEFLAAQGNNTRYHKGGIYHQIGVCLFLQHKTDDALFYFECAFIEDCISGFEASQLPAYSNLYNVYRISAKQLADLSSKIRKDNHPLDSEKYLQAYIAAGNKLDSIALMKNKNVFVGGNYKNIALLKYIAAKVYECGFNPIMALNFEVSNDEDIYAHAMALLQDCGSAIFEITFDSGHLMEIERAINNKVITKENILLLFQQRDATKVHYISKMLLGVGVKPLGYMEIDNVPGLVNSFLDRVGKQT